LSYLKLAFLNGHLKVVDLPVYCSMWLKKLHRSLILKINWKTMVCAEKPEFR